MEKLRIRTTGVIDKVIDGDGGNVMYYVNIDLNGEVFRVQSRHYSSKTKSLPKGKNVEVDYIISSKGVGSVVILNENIILCQDDMGSELTFLAVFGILVIIVIIVL
ncbi:MAG: hypothetical protein ACK5JH_04035 [Anaerocolumna sp.]